MNRRTFTKTSLQAAASVAFAPSFPGFAAAKPSVRLGGPLFETFKEPEGWVATLQKLGYRAAYCPV